MRRTSRLTVQLNCTILRQGRHTTRLYCTMAVLLIDCINIVSMHVATLPWTGVTSLFCFELICAVVYARLQMSDVMLMY